MGRDIDVGVLCIIGREEEDESPAGFEEEEGVGDERRDDVRHLPRSLRGDVVVLSVRTEVSGEREGEGGRTGGRSRLGRCGQA